MRAADAQATRDGGHRTRSTTTSRARSRSASAVPASMRRPRRRTFPPATTPWPRPFPGGAIRPRIGPICCLKGPRRWGLPQFMSPGSKYKVFLVPDPGRTRPTGADDAEKSGFFGNLRLATRGFGGHSTGVSFMAHSIAIRLRSAGIPCFHGCIISKGVPKSWPRSPASAPAAKPKQTTISLKQLAASLAGDHEMPKKQAEAILGDLVGLVTKHLKKGDRIRLAGLGILAGAQARRAHGPQPGHRRADPDQGEQEGCLPRRQGTQGSRLKFCGVFRRRRRLSETKTPSLHGWAFAFRRSVRIGQCILTGSSSVRLRTMN